MGVAVSIDAVRRVSRSPIAVDDKGRVLLGYMTILNHNLVVIFDGVYLPQDYRHECAGWELQEKMHQA